MSALLSIEVDPRPIEQVRAEVVVVSHFETDRPLRGAAGRADWRLCGLLSGLIGAQRLCGERGELALTPTYGRMKSDRLLLLGLGSREDFDAEQLRAATHATLRRVLALGAASVALPAPGESDRSLPLSDCADAILAGALAALADRPTELHLRWVAPEGFAARVAEALEAAARRARRHPVAVRITKLARPGPRGYPPPAPAGKRPHASVFPPRH